MPVEEAIPVTNPRPVVESVVEVIPDVQASADNRRVAIDKVGVKDITYPITLHCPVTGGVQHTVAQVNMYVGLAHHQKGTHMSRFLEVLNRHHGQIRSDQVMGICHDMAKRLDAAEAHLELAFPYFIHKKAPVTKAPGMLDVPGHLRVLDHRQRGRRLHPGHQGPRHEPVPVLERDRPLRSPQSAVPDGGPRAVRTRPIDVDRGGIRPRRAVRELPGLRCAQTPRREVRHRSSLRQPQVCRRHRGATYR